MVTLEAMVYIWDAGTRKEDRGMGIHRVETKLNEDGTLTLNNLPFRAGEAVDVIVISHPEKPIEAGRYSLRGTPIHILNLPNQSPNKTGRYCRDRTLNLSGEARAWNYGTVYFLRFVDCRRKGATSMETPVAPTSTAG